MNSKDELEVFEYILKLTETNKNILQRYINDGGVTSVEVYGYSLEDIMEKRNFSLIEALIYVDVLQKTPLDEVLSIIE